VDDNKKMTSKAKNIQPFPEVDVSGFDDFLEWLSSDEGRRCDAALDAVQQALLHAHVDAKRCKILWSDGTALTLNQTVIRIAQESQCRPNDVLDQVIGWLEMIYEPENLT